MVTTCSTAYPKARFPEACPTGADPMTAVSSFPLLIILSASMTPVLFRDKLAYFSFHSANPLRTR